MLNDLLFTIRCDASGSSAIETKRMKPVAIDIHSVRLIHRKLEICMSRRLSRHAKYLPTRTITSSIRQQCSDRSKVNAIAARSQRLAIKICYYLIEMSSKVHWFVDSSLGLWGTSKWNQTQTQKTIRIDKINTFQQFLLNNLLANQIIIEYANLDSFFVIHCRIAMARVPIGDAHRLY